MKICCIDIGVIRLYFGMMGIFLSYRFTFIIMFIDQSTFGDIVKILLEGMMSDAYTLSCALLPFSLIYTLAFYFGSKTNFLKYIRNCYLIIIFALFLFICCINILHYYYLHRLLSYNTFWQLFEWKCVAKMFIEERYVLIYLCSMAIAILLFVGIFFRIVIFNKLRKIQLIPSCLTLAVIIALGMVVKSPFLHSDNPQTVDVYYLIEVERNDARLNPVFELFRSCYDNLITDDVPLFDYSKMQSMHSLSQHHGINPIRNVVIIIMEGMQESFVNDSVLTPFLNKLKAYSLYYTNAYSAGVHTAHAIFSLHTGLPAQCVHPFYNSIPKLYESSLPFMLKQHGYRTLFMMPHNRRFDNMEGFLKLNGFDLVCAEDDFPKDSLVNVFGVNDGCLFSNAVSKIRQMEKSAPLLCTLLTVSNHIPYKIPKYFPKTGLELEYRIVQYADWALSNFFKEAEKEEWFDRTLFVLIGDHAREFSGQGTTETEAHHVAFFLYAPKHIMPSKCDNIVGHVDIPPTIMGYLGFHCSTKMYGIDVRTKKRRFLVMSSDKGLECIDAECYLRFENKNRIFCKIYKSSLVKNKGQHWSDIMNHLNVYCRKE